MIAKSASTTIVDSYRAGLTLGQSLAEVAPEIVFLFVTVQYGSWGDFSDGLHDGLDRPNVRVIGVSGDGFYETTKTSDVGAAALGLSSDGTVAWHVESSERVILDPEGAVRRTLEKLERKLGGRHPAFYFLVSDSNTDGSRIESVLREEVSVPVVGGIAGDDNSITGRSCLFIDRTPVRDSVVMLAVDGPLAYQVHLANSMIPVGETGLIDDAQGRTIYGIGGTSAADFVERQTGKPILRADQGIALTVVDAHNNGERRVRAIEQHAVTEGGAVMLHGAIRVGEIVQICMSNPADIEAETRHIAAQAAAGGLEPVAALIVSCAGRKWMLGGRMEYEVDAVVNAFNECFPIAGFSSFGEIGPLFQSGRYTRNLFHNTSFLLLLIGSASAPCTA